MSILNKPYEISVWGDTWDPTQDKFIEEKLLIIGSDNMISQSRVVQPKLVENVNGTHTLTFTIYYRYRDNITGQIVDNPYAPYLTNERKIKLKYGLDEQGNDKWYDFIIKNVKEDSSKYTYEISTVDQYVNELSKNGFDITLDPEITDPSNVGTVQELSGRILQNTDWEVVTRSSNIPIESEFIPDLAKETLVILETMNELNYDTLEGRDVYKLDDSINGLQPVEIKELHDAGIPRRAIIYAFYSCLADQTKRFQFIYVPNDVITTDDERIITNKVSQYYINNMQYWTKDTQYDLWVPLACRIKGISNNYRGARYVFSPNTRYNPIIDKYVTIYSDDNEVEYYGYIEPEYIAPNLIQNYITNSNAFKSTAGWSVALTDANYTRGSITAEAIRWDNGVRYTLLDDLRTGVFSENQTYIPVLNYNRHIYNRILNTGFYDNRVKIETLGEGDKYVIKFKAGLHTADGLEQPKYIGLYDADIPYLSITLGAYKYDAVQQTYGPGNQYCQVTNNHSTMVEANAYKYDATTGYWEWYVTLNNVQEYIDNNTSREWTKNTYKKQTFSKVYAILRIDQDCDIYDFQIYPDILDVNGDHLSPEAQAVEVTTINHHYLYNRNAIDSLSTTQNLADLPKPLDLTSFDGYNAEISCEKRRAITVKESNYFNIIQSLCETFECWAKFTINHDSLGNIIDKSITFHNYIGQLNYAGFRYGVNLKSIARTDDSKSIVTKLIVKQNSNEFGINGFCTIARAPSNETGEISIYNLDHYINQGLLTAEDWNTAIYDISMACGPDYFEQIPRWEIGAPSYPLNTVVWKGNEMAPRYYKCIVENSTAASWVSSEWQEIENNSNGYYIRLRKLNDKINEKNNTLLQQELVLSQAKADLNIYEAGKQAATDGFIEASEAFKALTNYEYNDFPSYRYMGEWISIQPYHIHDVVTYENQYYICIQDNSSYVPSSNPAQWSIFEAYGIIEANIGYLIKCAELLQAMRDYESKTIQMHNILTQFQIEYDTVKTEVENLIIQKQILNKAFYAKFYRFIQEGTWNSEEYYDDEKYYLDALSTLYNSSVPKVSYNISVLELSQLIGYEDFTFKVGDRTWMEDPEFFGYDINGCPIREEVVLSEITYNLDEPNKNSIKVQNFKTQFQDLFKRITATVQQVQYSTGAYDKAATLAAADNEEKSEYIQGGLSNSNTIIQNLESSTVRLDTDGLIITDGLESNKILRAISTGIFLSEDGGDTWIMGITANGINAKVINAGTINTSIINIMNGDEPTFRWDQFGLTAYDFTIVNSVISNINFSRGIRFDKLGIYGFDGAVSDWHPTNIVEWEINNNNYQIKSDGNGKVYVRNHSIFELTQEGLYLNLGNMVQKHYCYYNNNILTYDTLSTPITHNSLASIGRINDLIYNIWDSEGRPVYILGVQYNYNTTYVKGDIVKDTLGDNYRSLSDNNEEHLLSNTQYWEKLIPFVQVIKAGTNNEFAVYDDGTLIAKKAYLTGSINATSGQIGGWNIDNNSISKWNTTHTNYGITLNAPTTLTMGTSAITVENNGQERFKLTYGGNLTATNATITGVLTANNESKIGSWTVTNDDDLKGISGTDEDKAIWLMPKGNGRVRQDSSETTLWNYTGDKDNLAIRVGSFSHATFGITKNGELLAQSAIIGNWQIFNGENWSGSLYTEYKTNNDTYTYQVYFCKNQLLVRKLQGSSLVDFKFKTWAEIVNDGIDW